MSKKIHHFITLLSKLAEIFKSDLNYYQFGQVLHVFKTRFTVSFLLIHFGIQNIGFSENLIWTRVIS